MLVGKETRHRIVTFVCAVQRAKRKNEICANDDVVYMVLSMYFGDLVRNLDTSHSMISSVTASSGVHATFPFLLPQMYVSNLLINDGIVSVPDSHSC